MKQDHVIRREDPQAVEKLQKKLEDCEKTQAYMILFHIVFLLFA